MEEWLGLVISGISVLWSPHLHCFWHLASGSLEGGPGSSLHLTPRRHRERRGQGRGLSLYGHTRACRDCSPPRSLFCDVATRGNNCQRPKDSHSTHGCWKHFAVVLICLDVTTECHSFVSCTVVGAGNERLGCQQGLVLT